MEANKVITPYKRLLQIWSVLPPKIRERIVEVMNSGGRTLYVGEGREIFFAPNEQAFKKGAKDILGILDPFGITHKSPDRRQHHIIIMVNGKRLSVMISPWEQTNSRRRPLSRTLIIAANKNECGDEESPPPFKWGNNMSIFNFGNGEGEVSGHLMSVYRKDASGILAQLG